MAVALRQSKLKTYAGFIKLEHTVFSLPVIFAGTVLRLRRWPDAGLVGLILLAAIGARVVAMGLNRLIDAGIDARNPRTKQRELPRGAMRRGEAWGIVLAAGILYLAAAAAIAPICLWLSPIPVALYVIYPYLKRVTALAHLGLGLTWSMAPLAGWLAAASFGMAQDAALSEVERAAKTLQGFGEVTWLWLFSVLWVTGFDIIYATMDEAFDRREGLRSLPVLLGKRPALNVAAALHVGAFASLCWLWFQQLHADAALLWLLGIGVLFIWQHLIAERRPEFAFFQLNGLLGFLVFGMIWVGR